MHPEERDSVRRDHFERAIEGQFVPPVICRVKTKAGGYTWFETATQPVFEGGKIVKLRSVSRDVTERVEAQGLAAHRQEEIRKLMHALLRSQEAERKRIARDLHDDVAQRAAYITMQSETLLQKPGIGSATRQSLEKIRDDLESVTESLRHTAHQLHPSALEHLGLRAGLGALCEEISKHSKLDVRFQARNVPEKVPLDSALCLYRVLQEALRNVARHSGAERADVRLTGVKGAIRLTIRDSGKGFEPKALRGQKGLGLISMKERVELVGGRFQIEARPGGGVRIQAEVPLA